MTYLLDSNQQPTMSLGYNIFIVVDDVAAVVVVAVVVVTRMIWVHKTLVQLIQFKQYPAINVYYFLEIESFIISNNYESS